MPFPTARPAFRVLAFAALALLAAHARAAEFVVTDFGDDPLDPQPGTLRDALVRAGPGDTIRFRTQGTVRLRGPLTIGAYSPGVTIEGPADLQPADQTVNAVVEVAADGATLDGLTFDDVGVHASHVDGTTIRGSTFLRGAAVLLDLTTNAHVGTPQDGNTFRGDQEVAVETVEDAGTTIEGNDFRNAGDAVEAGGSDGLTVRGNTSNGAGFRLDVSSGTVAGNRIRTKRAAAAIHLLPLSAAADVPEDGAVRVEDNEVDLSGDGVGIRSERTGVEIGGNRVTGRKGKGTGIAASCGAEENSGEGTISVHDNAISGTRDGIAIDCDPAQEPRVVVQDNDVSRCKGTGVAARGGAAAEIALSGGTAAKCGVGIALRAGGPGAAVTGATATQCRGAGIDVQCGGGTLDVARCTSTRNRGAGCTVGPGDGECVVDACTFAQNRGDGLTCAPGGHARCDGTACTGNGGAGVFCDADATCEVRQCAISSNRGPGIDLAPRGVAAGPDPGWPVFALNPGTGRLVGTAPPGSRVEIYAGEKRASRGNPKNPEGAQFLGFATADGSGSFTYPASGRLPCPDTGRVVATATTFGASFAWTSEFSTAADCAHATTVTAENLFTNPSPLRAGQPGTFGATISNYGASAVHVTITLKHNGFTLGQGPVAIDVPAAQAGGAPSSVLLAAGGVPPSADPASRFTVLIDGKKAGELVVPVVQ